ncbi:MAG: type III pantothenate kinase, partial [Candidatus Thiodiazotropha sp.]
MKLYVDIGNSAIKWATEEDLRVDILHQEESHNLPAAIEQAWLKLKKPEAVYIASVRQQDIDAKLLSWIERHWQIIPLFAETRQREHGV